jgi:RNA polymerase sigma factor (TIGR02999 family)
VSRTQGQITKLLQDWSRGEAAALEQLTPLVYAELRKLARYHMSREAPGHTLQPTALINEAFLRLVDMQQGDWKGRKQFFAAASQIMRRVLVDYARKKRSIKRGREITRVPLEDAGILPSGSPALLDVLAFDEALSRLEAIDARKGRVVEFWFFAGMTVEEIADAIDIGTSTVQRDLDFAKVWLARELGRVENYAK